MASPDINSLATGLLLASVQYNELVARANTSTNGTSTDNPLNVSKPGYYKLIGLSLAICSGLFIGVSFILKKMGLLQANQKYNEEAGEGYGYLRNAWWWGGMTLMILGEICNFAAYLFADAILVTPLGALSVVVTAILSGIFLKERLSFVGKIGCFGCIIGAVVIAANAPEQGAVGTIEQMKHLVIAPGFLVYAGIVIVGCIFTALWVAPRYGKKSMLVYLTVSSNIGGLSVIMIQGIGAAITAQARGIPQFNQWFLYFIIVIVIVTLVTEIIYLNKALNLYNAALVTPTYYVYFTSCTIISSAVLFQGFKGTAIQILTVVLGFLQICSGVVLLQLSKSAKDVPDTAVFTGDLDQMRTVAEQEEPEYEPRADSMRGTAALIRAISTKRQRNEIKEAARIREEALTPVAENESFEWDGIRRRRTISSPDISSRPQRRKTIHPPLGMSYVPEEHETDDDDGGMHPGFWGHFKRKPVNTLSREHADASSTVLPLDPLSPSGKSKRPDSTLSDIPLQGEHSGLPSPLRNLGDPSKFPELKNDTAYHGAGGEGSHHAGLSVHFSPSASAPHLSGDKDGPTSSIRAVKQNEGARRQFSFHSVFNRSRSPPTAQPSRSSEGTIQGISGDSPVLTHYPYTSSEAIQSTQNSGRPLTQRSGLSFNRRTSGSHRNSNVGTEEERLGLVRSNIPEGGEGLPGYESPNDLSSSEGRGTPARSRRGTRGTNDQPPGYDLTSRRDRASSTTATGTSGAGAGAGAGGTGGTGVTGAEGTGATHPGLTAVTESRSGATSPSDKDVEAGNGASRRDFI